MIAVPYADPRFDKRHSTGQYRGRDLLVLVLVIVLVIVIVDRAFANRWPFRGCFLENSFELSKGPKEGKFAAQDGRIDYDYEHEHGTRNKRGAGNLMIVVPSHFLTFARLQRARAGAA
ncbi:MAG: hypothetical protein FJY92_00740 [Candidatus Hydrogenedentes bacterium]|nr:hypothetical protein [Candidatus Hydrogenedentota bacterium]